MENSYRKWADALGGTNYQRTQRIAKDHRLEVFYAEPDTLLLDYDMDDIPECEWPYLDTISRGGRKHRYVRLPEEMEVAQHLEWHAKLKSDPSRDRHIMDQLGESHPIALFETPGEAEKVREFMSKRSKGAAVKCKSCGEITDTPTVIFIANFHKKLKQFVVCEMCADKVLDWLNL